MAGDLERRVRVRAYEIWEREGRPAGCEREYWERPRQEVEAEGYGTEAPGRSDAPGEAAAQGRGRPRYRRRMSA